MCRREEGEKQRCGPFKHVETCPEDEEFGMSYILLFPCSLKSKVMEKVSLYNCNKCSSVRSKSPVASSVSLSKNAEWTSEAARYKLGRVDSRLSAVKSTDWIINKYQTKKEIWYQRAKMNMFVPGELVAQHVLSWACLCAFILRKHLPLPLNDNKGGMFVTFHTCTPSQTTYLLHTDLTSFSDNFGKDPKRQNNLLKGYKM